MSTEDKDTSAEPTEAASGKSAARKRGRNPQQLPSGKWSGRYYDATGKRQRTAAYESYREARDALAAAVAQVKRDRDAGRTQPREKLNVATYAERWLQRREAKGIKSVKRYERTFVTRYMIPAVVDDSGQRLGDLRLAHVRLRHARRLREVMALTTGEDGTKLAPRTVDGICGLLSSILTEAVEDELIDANPLKGKRQHRKRGEVRDKDPEWRGSAIFDRPECSMLMTDERIPQQRRVLYSLKYLAALRHSEAAALRWRHVDRKARPLGKLTIADAYDSIEREESGQTKTGVTRHVPILPELDSILSAWRDAWGRTYGKMPGPDDLVVPTMYMTNYDASHACRKMTADLETLGLRATGRNGHALRASFISHVQTDQANRDILKWVTHGQPQSTIMDGYSRFTWDDLCREVAKLKIDLTATAQDTGRDTAPVVAIR